MTTIFFYFSKKLFQLRNFLYQYVWGNFLFCGCILFVNIVHQHYDQDLTVGLMTLHFHACQPEKCIVGLNKIL